MIKNLDELFFDITENELSYKNFEKLFEVYITIKLSHFNKTNEINFKNVKLLSSLENRNN